jgi:hypothetical protein
MIARICRRGKPKGKIAIANDSARRLFESTPMVQSSPLESDFYLRSRARLPRSLGIGA